MPTMPARLSPGKVEENYANEAYAKQTGPEPKPQDSREKYASEACEEPKPQKNKVNHASLRRAYSIPEKVTGQQPKPNKSK